MRPTTTTMVEWGIVYLLLVDRSILLRHLPAGFDADQSQGAHTET
jgi:hypothetical protein